MSAREEEQLASGNFHRRESECLRLLAVTESQRRGSGLLRGGISLPIADLILLILRSRETARLRLSRSGASSATLEDSTRRILWYTATRRSRRTLQRELHSHISPSHTVSYSRPYYTKHQNPFPPFRLRFGSGFYFLGSPQLRRIPWR